MPLGRLSQEAVRTWDLAKQTAYPRYENEPFYVSARAKEQLDGAKR